MHRGRRGGGEVGKRADAENLPFFLLCYVQSRLPVCVGYFCVELDVFL